MGWTNGDLANFVGCDPDRISNALKADRVLRIPVANELFEAILFALDYLRDHGSPTQVAQSAPLAHELKFLRKWRTRPPRGPWDQWAPDALIPLENVSHFANFITLEILGLPNIGRTESNRKRISAAIQRAIMREHEMMTLQWTRRLKAFASDFFIPDLIKGYGQLCQDSKTIANSDPTPFYAIFDGIIERIAKTMNEHLGKEER